mgnify:FL=1
MGRLNETLRKSIHLSSLLIPFGYRYILGYNRRVAFVMLLAALVISLVIEFNRFWQRSFRKTFHRIFGLILRKHELKDFTGATYLLVASLLCVAFFDEPIAAVSIAYLSIGDTFAALIGMNFGKHNHKSMEGSLACFVSCAIFGLWWQANPWQAIVGALAATAAELSNVALDDNIKIPLASALAMTLVSLFI